MPARAAGLAVVALIAACSTARVTGDRAARSAARALTTRDGAFTTVQAERGRRVHDEFCASCHPAEFYQAQLLIWQHAPVSDLFEALSATMPSENPGVLATSEYLDVVAYILSITGSPAGDQELTVDNAGAVRIVDY